MEESNSFNPRLFIRTTIVFISNVYLGFFNATVSIERWKAYGYVVCNENTPQWSLKWLFFFKQFPCVSVFVYVFTFKKKKKDEKSAKGDICNEMKEMKKKSEKKEPNQRNWKVKRENVK